MEDFFSYIVAAVIVLAVIAILVVVLTRKKADPNAKATRKGKTKTPAQILKEANKRLEKNPHDPIALLDLGEIYYNSKLWDKAYTVYDELSKLAADNQSINIFKCTLRMGICAIQLEKLREALTALTIALKIDPINFEVNYYLGVACYINQQYEKAIPCFKKALVASPDAENVYSYLGQSLYKSRRFKDSLSCFKKALDEDPSNKELLYCMADAMSQGGHGDKAIKIFMHLRPDPTYGSRASLNAGLYHVKMKDIDTAIQDFEIGLKHDNIPADLKMEIQYYLARCYFEKNQIATGLNMLKEIRVLNSSYKDVNSLINTYQELSQNKNLQIYISSNSSDFVALCRRIIITKFSDATVKFESIDVSPIFTDILAQVFSSKWEDLVLFRFFRTTGSTGEMFVREFHAAMQDIKASRGFCISAGTFSEEGHKYIEGRPLDLVEKTDLNKILKKITF